MNDKVPAVFTERELQYLYSRTGANTGRESYEFTVDEIENGSGFRRTMILGNVLAIPLPEAVTLEGSLVQLKRRIMSRSVWFAGITRDLIRAHLVDDLQQTLVSRSEEDGSFLLYNPNPSSNGINQLLDVEVETALYGAPVTTRELTPTKVALRRFTEHVPHGVNYGELAQQLLDHFVSMGFQITDVSVDDVAPVYHFHIQFSVQVWNEYHAEITLTLRA